MDLHPRLVCSCRSQIRPELTTAPRWQAADGWTLLSLGPSVSRVPLARLGGRCASKPGNGPLACYCNLPTRGNSTAAQPRPRSSLRYRLRPFDGNFVPLALLGSSVGPQRRWFRSDLRRRRRRFLRCCKLPPVWPPPSLVSSRWPHLCHCPFLASRWSPPSLGSTPDGRPQVGPPPSFRNSVQHRVSWHPSVFASSQLTH